MIPQLTPQEVNNLLIAGEKVVLLDVREPEEYAICRLPGSVRWRCSCESAVCDSFFKKVKCA